MNITIHMISCSAKFLDFFAMLMIKFQNHRKCGMQGKFSVDVNKAPNVILINTEYAGM